MDPNGRFTKLTYTNEAAFLLYIFQDRLFKLIMCGLINLWKAAILQYMYNKT